MDQPSDSPRKRHRRYHLNEDFFQRIDTPTKAYLLGFIATDGCVSRGRLQIALKREDRAHLEKIVAAMGAGVPVQDYTASAKGKKYPYSVVFFHSVRLLADLACHGIHARKTFTVKPWQGDPALMPSYWLGAIDGDGSWFQDKRDKTWNLVYIGNAAMAGGFATFIKEHISVDPKTKEAKGGNTVLRYWSLPILHKIIRLLYRDSPLFLARKREKTDTILARKPRCVYHDWSTVTEEDLQALYRVHGTWEKVAAHFGMTRSAITALRWARRKGIRKEK